MSLADLIRGAPKSESASVATVTPATVATDRPESRSTVASVASVTVANAPERKTASRWRLHFADADALEVTFAPAVDRAEALARYPDALAAEPMPEPPAVPMPADLAALFDACAKAGLYDDADRAALPAMFALDAEGTRGLIEAMHSRIGRCRRCRHFRRPGLSAGYCTGRDDLPHVYGFMHALPEDGGARCGAFDEAGGSKSLGHCKR